MPGTQPQSKPQPKPKPVPKKKVVTPVAPDSAVPYGPPPAPPPDPPDGSPPGTRQGLTGPGRPPVITASGADAVAALKVIPLQPPVTVGGGAMGPVTLVPGTMVEGRLLLAAAPLYVYYIEDNDVWVAYTPDFVRNIWLNSMAKGVESSKWIIPLIKAEFMFIVAFIAPMAAVAALTIGEQLGFYAGHKELYHHVAETGLAFNDKRYEFKRRYPTLYYEIVIKICIESFINFPKGISLEDVAYLLGRILGHQGLLGLAEKGIAMTAKVVIGQIRFYTILVGLLHSPSIIPRGLAIGVKDTAENLKAAGDMKVAIEDLGFFVSKENASLIVIELIKEPDSKQFLAEFAEATQKFGEALEHLAKAREEW